MVPKFLPLVLALELKRGNSSRTRYLVTSRVQKELESGEKMEEWGRLQILSWPRDFYNIHPVDNAQGEPVGAKVYIIKKIMGDKKPEFKSITTKQIMYFFFLISFSTKWKWLYSIGNHGAPAMNLHKLLAVL